MTELDKNILEIASVVKTFHFDELLHIYQAEIGNIPYIDFYNEVFNLGGQGFFGNACEKITVNHGKFTAEIPEIYDITKKKRGNLRIKWAAAKLRHKKAVLKKT